MSPRWRPAFDWEARVERFVEARSEAAQNADRLPKRAGAALAEAHRSLAEGAWYVLELSRQRPELTTDRLRRAGAHLIDRWQASTDPRDRERWTAADWALWMHQGRQGGPFGRARRARSQGPVPGDTVGPPEESRP